MTLNWFNLVIIYVFTISTSKLIQKYVLKEEVVDPTAFSAFQLLMSGIMGIPFIFTAKLVYPHDPKIWLIALLSGILYTICYLLYFHAIKTIELSQAETIATTRIIWFMILGMLFFGETLGWSKFLGVALIFIGIMVIYRQKNKDTAFGKYHFFVLVYAIIVSCASALDKYALGYFSVEFYNSFLFILPGILTVVIFPKSFRKMKHLIKPGKNNSLILLSCLIQFVATLSLCAAYKIGELSLVGPLAQTSSVVTIIFGILLLNERWNLKRKIKGISIVFVGVVFLKFLVF